MLQPITEDLWSVERDLRLVGGLHFPIRMTVVRLADGGLLLHSPVSLDDPLNDALREKGEVTDILAPNLYHHLYLVAAAERFPQAQVWAAPGVADKQPTLADHHTLGHDVPEWQDRLTPLPIEGMPRVSEFVFLHRPSRTLLVTDLVFNIHHPRGWLTSLVLRLGGVRGRFGQSRLFRSQIRDRTAAAASARRVLDWDFDRIVPAHGEIVDSGAKELLRTALEPMTRARSR